MISHQGNLLIQEAACTTLSNRVAANPELIQLIGEGDDNLLPLHRMVLAALNIHSGEIYVFRAACDAIYEMAIHSANLQKYLYAKGASSSIIKEMNANSHVADVQCWGCKALRALAYRNPYQAELMFVEDVFSVVHKTLTNFQNAAVLQECISLLVCLATDLPILLRQCVTKKIPELVLQIGEEHYESTVLVEVALEAMGGCFLTFCFVIIDIKIEINDSIYDLPFFNLVFEYLSFACNDVMTFFFPCYSFVALFASSEVQQLLHFDSVRSIRKILDRHIDLASIQVKGCVIIQLVNGDLQFISNVSVFQEIVEILRNSMIRSVVFR